MSKAPVEVLGRSLAQVIGGRGITVNTSLDDAVVGGEAGRATASVDLHPHLCGQLVQGGEGRELAAVLGRLLQARIPK
ncbi:hypothetical protein [Streptosporangium sp. NPDC000396]|uniref:hypothetical protein n=1 Tax=Streptosporangium sp. NPDC000396 TaxID=3366185 RepID=UPI0036825B03